MSVLAHIFSSDKKLSASLKNMLGFYPDNISLYKQAFRHSSAAQEIKAGVKDSNERLEFLGDAILGAVVAEHLFVLFPYKDEGFLTKMRSKLVSRDNLNQLSIKLGIDKLIQSSLERGNSSNAIKGDAFEALIGAIYLDKGYNEARNFILLRIIKPHVDMHEVETQEDYKSKLIEWSQKEKKELRFNTIEEAQASNGKLFLIEVTVAGVAQGKGQHFSKRRAEQIAAQAACVALQI